MDWIGGVNGTIITPDAKNVTLLTNDIANAIERMVQWTSAGIISPSDMNFSPSDSLNRFLSQQSVFLRSTVSTADSVSQASFPWGMTFIPGTTTGPVGTIYGWNLGVYRYAKNPTWAMQLARYMTSQNYQSTRYSSFSDLYSLPTIPSLLTSKYIIFIALL